jgi:hypothetical protein
VALVTQDLTDLGQAGTALEHSGSCGVSQAMGTYRYQPGALTGAAHDSRHPTAGQLPPRGGYPDEHRPALTPWSAPRQPVGDRLPDISGQRQPVLPVPFPPNRQFTVTPINITKL